MIQCQLKLKLTPCQERQLGHWLHSLGAVWNWAIRKIEQDARDGIYYTPRTFQNLLAGHGKRIGIPSHVLQGALRTAHESWRRCFKGVARRPHFKGRRNRMNSISFFDPFRLWPNSRISVLGVGRVRYYKQEIPAGKIKCGRIVKRANGWYLCQRSRSYAISWVYRISWLTVQKERERMAQKSYPFYVITRGKTYCYISVVHRAGCSFLKRAVHAKPRSENPLHSDKFNNYQPCLRCNPKAGEKS